MNVRDSAKVGPPATKTVWAPASRKDATRARLFRPIMRAMARTTRVCEQRDVAGGIADVAAGFEEMDRAWPQMEGA